MRTKSELLLALATMIWGGTFVVIKGGLEYASPLLFMGLRFIVALAIFWAVFPGVFKGKNRQQWLRASLLGLCMFVGYAFQTIGLKYTTAGKSSMITYSFALMVPPLQWFVCKKPLKLGNLLGLVVVSGGLFFMTWPSDLGSWNRGDLISLVGAVGYAFFIVLVDKYGKDESPEFLTAVEFLSVAVISFLSAPLFETIHLQLSWALLGSLIYLSVLGSVVALYLMTRFQSGTTPVRAVIIYSLEPLISVFLGITILSEPFGFREAFGALFILLGVVLSELWEPLGQKIKKSRVYRLGDH